MNSNIIVVDLELVSTPGPVKARATLRIELPGGVLVNSGYTVIEKDGKPPWVGFPSKQGKIPGKYFPVVEAEGELRNHIIEMILEAYRTAKAKAA
jgi:hypothetical protein